MECMTQPENTSPGDSPSRADYVKSDSRAITRPAIGVLVDPERMAAARKSAMLERVELSDLSKVLELTSIAAANGIDAGDLRDVAALRSLLADNGIVLTGKRIGISRDEIAKLETGGRKRPKITTLRKFLHTINHARALEGEPPIRVKDIQVPGEVLIPPQRTDTEPDVDQWDEMNADALAAMRKTIDAYQEASNEIHYASSGGTKDSETSN
jgi:hypothetical protein